MADEINQMVFLCGWYEKKRLEEHSQMIEVGGLMGLGIDSKIKQPNRGIKNGGKLLPSR